ncbi:MAG: extracellular solute-binding protein [Lachnospiraceae bacterium]|nr:extracellular solute-binding protein [Lachnospiraceae bacterium]MCD7765891.1 extracellular solute-binding protein [Lachnospiraceae bacterium]
MKRNLTKRMTCLATAAVMATSMFSASALGVSASEDKDVVTMLLPPVSDTYQDMIYEWEAAFEAENPDIDIEITTASWEDIDQKLNTQVNAGSPPDIAFVGYDDVSTYVDLGMALDLSQYLDSDTLADFDETILSYFQVEDGIYGLPAYCEVQCIGGNQEMLEAAGIDWQSIQENGWTYDEFREAIAAGVITDGDEVTTYGFVFACSGVTAADYFNIFVNNAGMPSAFDEDLKYTYTSSMMLDFLEDIRALIDDGSMPSSLNSVDAGMRWNMFLTGQTMITGKGLSSFERSAANNNALIEAGEGEEVEGSIEVNYIVLPVPVFENGTQNAYAAVDGYICLTGETDPDADHVANVAKVAYYFASGERAALTTQELYLTPVCETGTAAYEELDPIENKNEYNTAAVQNLTAQVAAARPDIPASLSAQATTILDEVIVPKFQSLLAGETTAQEMYDAIVEAAYDAFGEDGCVTD